MDTSCWFSFRTCTHSHESKDMYSNADVDWWLSQNIYIDLHNLHFMTLRTSAVVTPRKIIYNNSTQTHPPRKKKKNPFTVTSILKHHKAFVQTLGSAALCLKLWQINICIFGVWDSQSREIKVNASGFLLLACHKRKIKPAAGKTCSGKLWKMNIYTRAGLFCANIFTSFTRLLHKSQCLQQKHL